MKYTLITVFMISFFSMHSQKMFDYEKEIKNIGDYAKQEIYTFSSDSTVALFGTLISPKKDFEKIVVIVPGSGNISQYGYNFLTESLLENNIGVYRFDRRGVGKSGGTITGNINKYSEDLLQIFKAVQRSHLTTGKSIGAIGHSQGGIAIMEALEQGAKIDFLVQWATPVGKPRDIVEYQIEQGTQHYDKDIRGRDLKERLTVLNFVHEIIDANKDEGTWEIWKAVKKEGRRRNIKKRFFKDYVVHHNVLFAKLDNTSTYTDLDIPTLFIIGGKDKLVDPIQTAQSLKNMSNEHITVKTFENLNHFLRQKDMEMSSITNEIFNVDLEAKNYITNWINMLPDNTYINGAD